MNHRPEEIAELIKQARTEAGLTQKQLADAAQIGKTAMFDLEHGNPGVRLNTLLAVLSVLGLELRVETGKAVSPKSEVREGVEVPEKLPDYLL